MPARPSPARCPVSSPSTSPSRRRALLARVTVPSAIELAAHWIGRGHSCGRGLLVRLRDTGATHLPRGKSLREGLELRELLLDPREPLFNRVPCHRSSLGSSNVARLHLRTRRRFVDQSR